MRSFSSLTGDFWVQKVGIGLPQIFKIFRLQRYIVISILKQIICQRQARFSPNLVHEHVDTKVHVLNVDRIYVYNKYAELNGDGIVIDGGRSLF